MATPILLSAFAELRHKWGWLLALGICMIVLGAVALAILPAATLGTTIVLGWLLVVSGIFETIHGFQVRRSHSMFLHLIGGVLGVLIGLLVITHPVAGALAWTLLFASFLTVIGLFRIIAAARLKFPHWGWAVFDGSMGGMAMVSDVVYRHGGWNLSAATRLVLCDVRVGASQPARGSGDSTSRRVSWLWDSDLT